MKINLRKFCVSIGIILVNINIYIYIAGNMLTTYFIGSTDSSYYYDGEYLLLITASFVAATIILHLALLGRKSLNKKVYVVLMAALIYFIVYAFNSTSGLGGLNELVTGLIMSAYVIVVAIAYKIISHYFKVEII